MGVDPFVGTEALAAGLVNRYQLATRHDAVYRNVYVPRGQQLTPVQKAKAAWLWSGRRATVLGSPPPRCMVRCKSTASACGAEPTQPAKTTGIVLRNDILSADETAVAAFSDDSGQDGFRPGPPVRPNPRRHSPGALMAATDLKPAEVEALIDRHRRVRGIVQLRAAIGLADAGAESRGGCVGLAAESELMCEIPEILEHRLSFRGLRRRVRGRRP